MAASTSSSESETTADGVPPARPAPRRLGPLRRGGRRARRRLWPRPTDAEPLTMLARVHLAADRPAEALAAADAAVAAAPGDDRRRWSPGAWRWSTAGATPRRPLSATEILRRLPGSDPYAQRTGAALLGESRNGQQALNAAWRGVKLAPERAPGAPGAGVVAARLRLFDLAEQAYGRRWTGRSWRRRTTRHHPARAAPVGSGAGALPEAAPAATADRLAANGAGSSDRLGADGLAGLVGSTARRPGRPAPSASATGLAVRAGQRAGPDACDPWRARVDGRRVPRLGARCLRRLGRTRAACRALRLDGILVAGFSPR